MNPDPSGAAAGATGRPGMRRIARGGALNLFGAGVSSVTGLLLVVVVTRTVPKADAGVFFALTSVFLLAEIIVCLGTGTGLVYFIARMRSLGQTHRVRSFLRAGLTPVIVLSAVSALALIALATVVARLVGADTSEARIAVVLLAVLLPVAALSDTVLAATRGHATMRPTVTLDKVTRPVLQLVLVALAALSGSVWLLSGAWALPWVGSALLGVWWLRHLNRSLPRRDVDAVPARATWREFWGFTWARGVNSVAQLMLQRFDILLITVLLGPAPAAVYTAATRFLVVGQFSNVAIANAAQPRLAELFAVDARTATRHVYQSATAWVILLTWPLYLLCAVFADVVLKIFGHGYGAGRPIILVLAAAMLVATGCGMVDMMLNMAGRTTWTLANSVLAVAVMVGVDLLLIPRLGILGAGIGWAAAILANNLVPLTQLLVSLRLHPFGRATFLAAALAAACFGVLPGLTRLAVPHQPLAAVAAVVVGAALFLAGCLRWRTALELPALSALRPGGGRRQATTTPLDATPAR